MLELFRRSQSCSIIHKIMRIAITYIVNVELVYLIARRTRIYESMCRLILNVHCTACKNFVCRKETIAFRHSQKYFLSVYSRMAGKL